MTVLTITAPIDPDRRTMQDEALVRLAASTDRPPHLPFSAIDELHFASVVVFVTPGFESLLVLELNFDGALEPLIERMLDVASVELYTLFSCCRDFPTSDFMGASARDSLSQYLRGHVVRAAAFHVGNVGRPQRRVAREAELHSYLSNRIDHLQRAGWRPTSSRDAFMTIEREMKSSSKFEWVTEDYETQTEEQRARPWFDIAGFLMLLAGVLLAAWWGLARWSGSRWIGALWVVGLLLVVIALVVVSILRHEVHDEPMDPATLNADHVDRLVACEDHLRLNHLASVTVVKEGWYRRVLLRVVLFVASLLARLSTKGTLSGIPSIHFAHWSLVDGGRRLMFLSNYDGSWGSYLDDFVDKAAQGLTGIWSNTRGFPRTRLLIMDGARDGAAFKAFARAQQSPTAVWYVAEPYRENGLSVKRVNANTELRIGLARGLHAMSNDELSSWCRQW